MKAVFTIVLLLVSNIFMSFAWYGHLKFSEISWLSRLGMIGIIIVSWGIALLEYSFMIPANRMGYKANGGPFSLLELKVIQEVITLVVFIVFTMLVFKTESLRTNHVIGLCFLVLSVYFIFKK